jgi:hypothetical protein
MNKLDNYIYLTICEIAMKEMKKTNYASFVNFCGGMAYSLSHNSLYSREKDIIISLTSMLDKIYSMDDVTTANFIVDFFNMESERIISFQRCVMETQEFYPMSAMY